MKAGKWWPKGFRVWVDKKPPFRARCQHRKSGVMVDLVKFPPKTAAFYAECARLDAAHAPDTVKPGTLAAIVEGYRGSRAFLDLAPRTRADYQKVFDYLHPIRDTELTRFTTPFIVKLRDRAHEKRGERFGTYVKAVLSVVFGWARERGFVADNPAKGVKGVKRRKDRPDANRPWSDSERDAVLSAAPPHMRPALAVMMFTGLAPGDALSLPRGCWQGGSIEVRRNKTGVAVSWPVIAPLKAILDDAPAHDALTLCANSYGRPWTASGFRASWRTLRSDLEAAGRVQPHLTLYGLRHTVATILREAGLDERAIADALGQKTEAMARHYAKAANLRRKMGGVAEKFETEVNNRRTGSVKPTA
ncbi:tyrosine-type recombinase/integrase [Microvirga tunisiensis]|uniref:Tyrosine-type recombinase/integrase n=2 Tax=Pannonibacter tanglangensis TaxID=2750084 RepID=A0A7X5J6X6_9HYPH|nr:tyrosine-type recombinase/integrase [Pannonibacter sp. XCT-53]